MKDFGWVTELVARRAAGLTLYARQWLDAAEAEDVVQEALTAMLSQRTAPDDPVAWMCRAVRNAAIDHARATARRRRREQTVAQSRREWFEPRPDALIDGKTAEDALRLLPPEQREVVVLRIWGGLHLAQIAKIVGAGVTTVHTRYTQALTQLRNVLEKSCTTKTTA